MPCLRASGPDHARPAKEGIHRSLSRQLAAAHAHLPPSPADLTEADLERVLKQLGLATRHPGRRPARRAFWNGLFRAIVLDRDDYRCYFCRRSGEDGVHLPVEGRLALRLELDHVEPRAHGGHDYVLANIRTLCRTCNLARGRLTEDYFWAELRSLANFVSRLEAG